MLCYVVLFCVVLCRDVVLCKAMSCHDMSCYVTLFWLQVSLESHAAGSPEGTTKHNELQHAMKDNTQEATLSHVMSATVGSDWIMLRYAVLCAVRCAVLCYVLRYATRRDAMRCDAL